MGILDNLLKKGAQSLAGDLAKKVTDTLSETLGVDLKEVAETAKEEHKSSCSDANSQITVPVSLKLRNILGNQFPEYTFAENVDPVSVGGPEGGMPFSFAVSGTDGIKLFIMIIGRNTCTHKDYKLSRAFAEERGIQFINFIDHFENKVSYVTQRLHEYL